MHGSRSNGLLTAGLATTALLLAVHALQAKLPAKAGMLYWPVSQICEDGKVDWAEVPKPGQKLSDLKSPAAALELMPVGGGGEHNH